MKHSKEKIGLALSGGGYRAVAFHLGTLRALHKMGLLDKVDVISSVSGGSIIAAYYALHKDESFEQFEAGLRKGLSRGSLSGAITNLAVLVLLSIVIPLVPAIFFSVWFLFLTVPVLAVAWYFGFKVLPSSKWIAFCYDRIFFKDKRLKDFPDAPFVGINSTNIAASGRLFTFSKQDVGGYDYRDRVSGRSIINGADLRISFAVSSSTCVPSFFTPNRIDKKYFADDEFKETMLVDGGLYDNQGAYILTQGSNKIYRTNNVIVSDAGNSAPSTKKVRNHVKLSLQTIEVLMNRIRTMQQRENIYCKRYDVNDEHKYDNVPNFAYLSLRWDNPESMVERFLYNIRQNHIPKIALECHGISNDEVKKYVENNDKDAELAIGEKFKKSVGWEELLGKAPSKETYDLAYSVGTNLIPLSKEKIDALSSYAEWLTELQVKTYLPHLL